MATTGKKRGRPAGTKNTPKSDVPVVTIPAATGKKRGRPTGSKSITDVMTSEPKARKATGAAAHKQYNDDNMIQFALFMEGKEWNDSNYK